MLLPVGYVWYFYDFNVWKRLKSHFGRVDQTHGRQASGQNPQRKMAAVLTHVDSKFIDPYKVQFQVNDVLCELDKHVKVS